MRVLVRFILQGRFRAMIIAGLLGGVAQILMPLSLVSSAIVGLVVLRRGEREGFVVLLGVTAIILVINQFVESRPGFDLPVTLLFLGPVFVCASILRITEAQGIAIAAASICAALFAIVIQVYTGDAVSWWGDWLKIVVQGVEGAKYQGFEDNGTLRMMNGLIAMLLSLAVIISLLLARWMQAQVYHPGGFGKEFQVLQIPGRVSTFVALLILILAVVQRQLMYDLIIIFGVMYFFQGLAILHHNNKKKGYSTAYLMPPYLLLIFIPHYVFVGMACVGISDLFINYRKLPK